MRRASAWIPLLVLLLLGAAMAAPPPPTPLPIGSPGPAGLSGAPALHPAPSPSPLAFDLPPLVVPRWGPNWWEEPFLFEMADGGKLTGPQRAGRVLDRVHEVVDRVVQAGGYPLPEVVVDQDHGVTVVRTGAEVLVTVLPEDLPEYAQQLAPEKRRVVESQVAARWAELLEREIQAQVTVRTPQFRWLGLAVAAGLLVAVILLNAGLDWFARRYMGTPLWSLRALVWVAWLTFMLDVVPELDSLQRLVQGGLLEPLWLLLTAALGSALLFQLLRAATRRYVQSLSRHRPSTPRQAQRVASLEGATFFALRLAVFLGAAFYVITGLGIEPTHLLAGAGLFGAALTLVAQDLIRDLIAGVSILLEDQFVVGDWIEAGAVSGTVEAFHLRGTRVRGTDGTACVVPNSELRTVRNHSLEWSAVDYQVAVAMDSDAEKALRLLGEEADRLASERPEQVLAPPQVLGLEGLGPDGFVLRVVIQTHPLQQWAFKRELNRRVLARFLVEGIDLAGRRARLVLEREAGTPGEDTR